MSLSVRQVTAFKKKLRKQVNDNGNLFDACWREVLKYARQADIHDYSQLYNLYNNIASQKVNNPRSKFYIYG